MTNAITRDRETLKNRLLAMNINDSAYIEYQYYAGNYVRGVVKKLNKEGYMFHTTCKGVINGMKVERLK